MAGPMSRELRRAFVDLVRMRDELAEVVAVLESEDGVDAYVCAQARSAQADLAAAVGALKGQATS